LKNINVLINDNVDKAKDDEDDDNYDTDVNMMVLAPVGDKQVQVEHNKAAV
jgi:hypothetical protein